MALLNSIVQSSFLRCLINLRKHLLLVTSPLAHVSHYTTNISSLAELKKGTDLTHTLSCHTRFCLPFVIEVTLLKAFNNFELVLDHPVFLCVLFKVE